MNALASTLRHAEVTYIDSSDLGIVSPSHAQSNLVNGLYPGLKGSLTHGRWDDLLVGLRSANSPLLNNAIVSCVMGLCERDGEAPAEMEQSRQAKLAAVIMAAKQDSSERPSDRQILALDSVSNLARIAGHFDLDRFIGDESVRSEFPEMSNDELMDLAQLTKRISLGGGVEEASDVQSNEELAKQAELIEKMAQLYLSDKNSDSVVNEERGMFDIRAVSVEDSAEAMFVAAQHLALQNHRFVAPTEASVNAVAKLLTGLADSDKAVTYDEIMQSGVLKEPTSSIVLTALLNRYGVEGESSELSAGLPVNHMDKALSHALKEIDILRAYQVKADDYSSNPDAKSNIPEAIMTAAQEISHAAYNVRQEIGDDQIRAFNELVSNCIRHNADNEEKVGIHRTQLYRHDAFSGLSPQTLDVVASAVNANVLKLTSYSSDDPDALRVRTRGASLAIANCLRRLESQSLEDSLSKNSVSLNNDFVSEEAGRPSRGLSN